MAQRWQVTALFTECACPVETAAVEGRLSPLGWPRRWLHHPRSTPAGRGCPTRSHLLQQPLIDERHPARMRRRGRAARGLLPRLYGRHVADTGTDDLDARRRLGLEMQAELPQGGHHLQDRPVIRRVRTVADASEGGCLLAELGPIGLFIGVVSTIVLFLKKRRRTAG